MAGQVLSDLCGGVCTGLCPDWETWDNAKPVDNATEAMQLADDWLGIPQVGEQGTRCSHHAMPHHATPCHTTPHHAIPHHTTPPYISPHTLESMCSTLIPANSHTIHGSMSIFVVFPSRSVLYAASSSRAPHPALLMNKPPC